jgi:uncharacterized membrane protein
LSPTFGQDPGFEKTPLTRPEYIAALVHFYRGEMSRANIWRTRLDTTTNWSIITVMGLLSFAFNDPQHSHASILTGMLLVLNFLVFEARRYRFYDVWRNRVRMIEENFYMPVLTRDLDSPQKNWGNLVGNDLLSPTFKITFLQAFRARFVRNYWLLFLLLLLAWLVKTLIHPVEALERQTIFAQWAVNMSIGPIPWWMPLIGVFALYGFFLHVVTRIPHVKPPEESYWSSGKSAIWPDQE